jgi:hypothetical protein
MGESRSGCHIARVSERDEVQGTSVIFKEGRRDKLREEKDGIERWEAHMPGVAPRIYSYHESVGGAGMLLEFLPGKTFEQILLDRSNGAPAALAKLTAMLDRLWTTTRRPEPTHSAFAGQLRDRMGDVYAVHPVFRVSREAIGPIAVPSYQDLLERATAHGDFNVDNIIIDFEANRVRLIDLHRSGFGDYAQDASVFIVSNARLQVFDRIVRGRINDVILRFHEFCEGFARRAGDDTFELRLGFGLARSFATSTRFILDEGFAKSLFLRSRYLLHRLLNHSPSQLREFFVPREVLID